MPFLSRRPAVLAAVIVALAVPSTARAADPFPIEPRAIADLKAVLATVESVRTPTARARIGGTITQLTVVEGDSVTEGQVIARIVDLKIGLQLAAFDAKEKSLAARLDFLKTELDRARQLRAAGSGTQSRLDDAESQLRVTEAEIGALRAEQAVVAEQAREGAVLAPASGRVLRVSAIAGQVVMPGEPIATLATANYIVKLRLPERHARSLKVGDPVIVGDRDSGATSTGSIVRVYPELQAGEVVADVEAAAVGDFFVGERVRVSVSTGDRAALVMPTAWVSRRSGLAFATLASGAEVPVQLGHAVAGATGTPLIEVLSGLKVGDAVIAPKAAGTGAH